MLKCPNIANIFDFDSPLVNPLPTTNWYSEADSISVFKAALEKVIDQADDIATLVRYTCYLNRIEYFQKNFTNTYFYFSSIFDVIYSLFNKLNMESLACTKNEHLLSYLYKFHEI